MPQFLQMPPKIRGMNLHSTPQQSATQRFTLMIPGEDTLDLRQDSPPKGLPQERFLLGDNLPIAPVLLLGKSNLSLDPSQVIACLQPVHLHATRDHLILLTQSQIELTAEESQKLLQIALPFIEEDFQNKVLFQEKDYWFLPAGPFSHLGTHSIDQAHGRNIDWWMPRDTHQIGIAKLWRKLQNEIQMLWHIDPVNQSREQQGLPAINSLWISGIGKLQDIQVPNALKNISHIYGEHPLLSGLAKYIGASHHHQVNLSQLANAFAWINHPEAIWNELRDALIHKKIDEIEIIDFPNGDTRHRILTAKDLHKKSWAFWKRPQLFTWQEIASRSS